MPRRAMWTGSSLGTFVASTVVGGFGDHDGLGLYTPRGPERERRRVEHGPWQSLYPMPPPYPWSVGAPPDSSRRRERWRLRRAVDLLVNLIICANSYLVLHRPRVYPRALRVPRPPDTAARQAIVAGLREDAALLFRPPHFFGRRGKAKLISIAELADSIFRAREGDAISPPAGMVSSPFVAARAKFLDVPSGDLHRHCFDPAPWLQPFDAACYLEPRLLEWDAGACPLPTSRFGASRAEALEFIQKLDRAGRLYLSDTTSCPKEDRMNLLAVYKSAEVDRTVWDRRRRN